MLGKTVIMNIIHRKNQTHYLRSQDQYLNHWVMIFKPIIWYKQFHRTFLSPFCDEVSYTFWFWCNKVLKIVLKSKSKDRKTYSFSMPSSHSCVIKILFNLDFKIRTVIHAFFHWVKVYKSHLIFWWEFYNTCKRHFKK